MKRKIKSVVMVLLLMVMFPVTMFLTGCGATPTNEVRGVFFQSDMYDEKTGYAVFEVDLGVKTKLDYKINPSTWSGYAISYAFKEASGQNLSRFTFTPEDGCIDVNSVDFEEIKVDIMVNKKVDTCIVRLKKYPTNMFLIATDNVSEVKEKEININALGSYTICPVGKFTDANNRVYKKSLIEKEFDFKVTSDDETVVAVPNKNRLKICSVRKTPASANVTVALLDSTGKELFSVKLKVNVVQNVVKSVSTITGYDDFIPVDAKDKGPIEILASRLQQNEDDQYLLTPQIFLYGEDSRYIDEEKIETAVTVSDPRYVDVENGQIMVKKGINNELTFRVYVWTNLIKTDGMIFSFIYDVKIKF